MSFPYKLSEQVFRALILGPTADTHFYPSAMVISMGNADQLRRLSQILSPIER